MTTFRLGMINAAAGLIIALLAPLLGAIADRGGRRKRMLLAFSLLGIGTTFALYFVGQGQWMAAALLFCAGHGGVQWRRVFCDALLLDVAVPRDYDRVSAQGYALGYLGGGLLFAINVLMVSKPALFGLADATEAVRWSFVTVAIWWAVFMLPLLAGVREAPAAFRTEVGSMLADGWQELARTARHVRAQPALLQFLVAYWLYIGRREHHHQDGVNYGMTLGLESTDLLGALLLTQFVAFPASLAFGWLGRRLGARTALLSGLGVYAGIVIWAYVLDSALEFYLMAAAVGLVQGGVQSLSRSLYGRLVPTGKSAEFFGFYNMVGKFGTVLGPALMAGVALVTG